jgi:hypothetical protein
VLEMSAVDFEIESTALRGTLQHTLQHAGTYSFNISMKSETDNRCGRKCIHTFSLKCPHKKISESMRSGNCGGHAMGHYTKYTSLVMLHSTTLMDIFPTAGCSSVVLEP